MSTVPIYHLDLRREKDWSLRIKLCVESRPLLVLRRLGIMIFVSSMAGCAQGKVDAQMEELCKEDGGMMVYEQVLLPRDQFKEHGNPAFYKTWNTSGNGYTFSSKYNQIRLGNPSLSKTEYSITRESDNKVLGTYVTYLRIGGAILWRPGPDPAKICPGNVDSHVFLNTVFTHD